MKHFLSTNDWTESEIQEILNFAKKIKKRSIPTIAQKQISRNVIF